MVPTSQTFAPELQVSAWFNTAVPLSLATLRGRVVVLYAFQMLCPACVSHGLPQVMAIRNNFDQADVAVIGLHSVFEHHDVMTPKALEAFIHEYRIPFPVAIDLQSAYGPIPLTMARYGLRGTPSLILIDQGGCIRHSKFGVIDDMWIGSAIGGMLAERSQREFVRTDGHKIALGCGNDGCGIA